MNGLLRRWWSGPFLFAVLGSPVAGAVVMLIGAALGGGSGEPFNPLLLVGLPPFVVLFAFMALSVGIPAVLLGGAVAGVLARGRLGTIAYVLLLAAWSAALALVGHRLDVLKLKSGNAFILPDAWQFALGWAVAAALASVLLRRAARPSADAGT